MRKTVITLVLLLILGSAAAAQDAKTFIDTASKAMGAENLKSIQYSGPGSDFSFGQAYNPASPWPEFKNKTYTRTIDYQMPAYRIERVQEPIDPQRRGGGLAPAATQTVVINPNSSWAQQLEVWKTPHGFLKAAATNNATLRSQTIAGKKYNVLSFTGQNKAMVQGYFDNSVTGDTPLEVRYTDYKDFGGVKFPSRILERQFGLPVLDLSVTDVKPNIAANIQPPQGRGGAPGGAGAPAGGGGGQPPAATSQKLGEGVYVILPGYAALAVEFKDYIAVVEGPQSEARATAIITEAKRIIPNKPIRYVVNTHIHFDHSGGMRAFVAEGATIITHQANKGYFEKVLAPAHTLNPDRQQREKKKIKVETFGDKRVLTDGKQVLELHHLKGNLHQEGMIVAYVPKDKILVEADVFNPPAQANAPPAPGPVNPSTLNLVDNLDRLKLDVETIVPVHYPADGRKVTKAELMKAAGKVTSN
jgi:glyoxylase-like metal-dependent hydrolase (beta-lactamase superfamily II)